MATASDDFNRADASGSGALGANWDDINGWFDIVSNRAVCGAQVWGITYQKWAGSSFGDDHFSAATVEMASGDWGDSFIYTAGVAVRIVGTGAVDSSCYLGCVGSNEYNRHPRIMKIVATGGDPTVTVLAEGNENATGATLIRLEVSGSGLVFLVDGVEAFSVTDGAIASGAPGLGSRWPSGSHNTVPRWDDWSGGDLATVGAAVAQYFNQRNDIRPRLFAPGHAR